MPAPLDLEQQLRQHGTALRRLAFELLGDEADADDAVQETWLRAMRGAPREPERAGGWLATILTNVVRRSRRGESRRRRREIAAARPEATDDVAVVVAREEVVRRLLDAVSALQQPYRDAIWQRWFEGRAPREIAAANGIPVATVKSRLQCGIRMLRDQLGKAGGGEWRAAFGAAFGFGKNGAAAGAVALVGGGTVMATWTKITGAVVVLGALALSVRWFASEDGVVVERAAEAGASRVVAAALDAPAAQSPVSREAVAALEPTATVRSTRAMAHRRGRVVDVVTKQPLAGVTVALGYTMAVKPGADDAQIVTGDDGRFDFECQPERQSRIWFAHPERLAAWSEAPALDAGEDDDVGDVWMTRGRALTGRVVDAGGRPVAVGVFLVAYSLSPLVTGANCTQAYSSQALVGADGSLTLPPIALGDVVFTLPPASDHELLDVRMRVTESEPAALLLVATPRPFVAGHVVDPAGRPIAGVTLSLFPSGFPVTTSDDGAFRLRQEFGKDVPANVGVRVAPEFLPPEGRTVGDCVECLRGVAWGTTGLRVELARSARLAIEVVDDAGAPVVDFGVVLDRPMLGDARGVVRHRGPHENGRLDVEWIAPGSTSLRVVPGDSALSPSEVLSIASLAPQRVVLSRRLAGVVEVEKNGRPMPGAFVDLVRTLLDTAPTFGAAETQRPQLIDPHTGDRAQPGDSRFERIASGRTDENGRVTLLHDVVTAGRSLLVQIDGFAPTVLCEPVFPRDDSPLRVTMPALGFVDGRIELRGRSPRDFGVLLERANQRLAVRVRSTGEFRSLPLPAGRWRASVRTKDVLIGSEREVEIVDGAATTIGWDLAAFAAASLRGRFVSDVPIDGFVVDLSRVGPTQYPQKIATAAIGADGRFAAEDLVAGNYRFVVRPASGAGVMPWIDGTIVQLAAGEHRDVEIAFAMRRLVVKFRKPDGSEARGERVLARSDGVQWTVMFGLPVGEQLVIDPAPTLPIEFRSSSSTAWSAAVQMPADQRDAEVTVVLPDPPK